MSMKKAMMALILGGLLAAPLAFASVDRNVLQVESIRSQQAEIRSGVEARTGRYKDLSADTRSQLLNKQGEVLRLLDGKQSTNDLNEAQKTEVFNALEWIEAAINQTDDERMVCERRPILGSTRKERVCKTVAQMREERDAARNRMDARGACADCKSN
ncbi:hypothetical protein ASE43_18815 [Lysobacter sp. Root983]|nr:hypothetical protein ASD69_08690 [Lysobacter sp. Root604]KRD28575.1 hypothetical protein ASE35_20080 [Lysobacter sp. Root916]KRD73441.1 hypothetical protein ASE43_18815 [Lysobacter sp. Root983]